jgi:hypothetical protein
MDDEVPHEPEDDFEGPEDDEEAFAEIVAHLRSGEGQQQRLFGVPLSGSPFDWSREDASIIIPIESMNAIVIYDEMGEVYSLDDVFRWLSPNDGEACKICGAPDPVYITDGVARLLRWSLRWNRIRNWWKAKLTPSPKEAK